jgi:hypothetical protein
MALSEQVSGIDAVLPTETTDPLSSSIKSLAQRITRWASACADYYEAAALYDQLSRLSNAELHRRGLSRETLARDVCQSCDRTAER